MEITHSYSKEIEILNESKKCCAICKTTKTPLWRNGPTGPKSLCNACGIKYAKKSKEGHRRKKKKSKTEVAKEGKMGKEEVCNKLLKGKEVAPVIWRRKLGEVEQAAAILMALSCSSVFD